MAEKLTRAGADLLAFHQGNLTHCKIDKFILAYVPGQSPAVAIDPDRGLPAAEQIVHEQAVTRDGYLSPGMVVYSLYMDATVGDFTFNTIYTVSTENSNTVMQIVTVPDTPKVAENVGAGVRGQPMVRNLVMLYDDVATITNVTVEAAAWQWDFEDATETVKGFGKIASQAEVDAGEDDFSWVTSLKLKSRLTSFFVWANLGNKPLHVVSSGNNASGFWRRWSDGTIEQWGWISRSDSLEHEWYFPIQFTTTVEGFGCSTTNYSDNRIIDTGLIRSAWTRSVLNKFKFQFTTAAIGNTWSITWRAWGR